jgi:hypothetical protein
METRRNRGATRIADMSWNQSELAADLARFDASDFGALAHGAAWAQVQLVRPDGRGGCIDHPRWAACSAFQRVAKSFGGKVMNVTLASLGPGGSVKEHRDISGGLPMGVARFHVPVVTHRDVEFIVDRKPVFMGPGEVWTLDTTYRHKLRNRSSIVRVHLIVDVELNSDVRALLPSTDIVDVIHRVNFAAICVAKGAALLVKNPRQLVDRVERVFRLKVLRQSQMTFEKG